jgi:NitT/TauT family transport system ATP-binding protein/nitrate/nitrite transport system substrate-binding protein
VAQGVGRFALSTGDIWPDHPEKVLAFAEGLAAREPNAVIAATAAVISAQRWLADPANRAAAVALLAERIFPGVAPASIAAALEGAPATPSMAFDPDTPPNPDTAARWFDEMRRWDHVPAGASEDAARACWRADLWQRAAERLGSAAGAPIPSPTQEPLA